MCLCTPEAYAQNLPPQEKSSQDWNLHAQQTIITQWHPSFTASYSGDDSLQTNAETSTSVTSTLFFSVRPWGNAQICFDPELAGGRGLSSTTGIAGFPNGDIFRVGSPEPMLYPARVYLQQTIDLGEDNDRLMDGPNQLSFPVSSHRAVISAGKFALTDFFDNNSYSHDPRRQLMNWALMSGGAWNYAADTRGYTWGLVVEDFCPSWSVRGSIVAVPT